MSLRDDELVLEPTSGSDDFTGFAVVVDGKRQGTVAFHHEAQGLASIRWGTMFKLVPERPEFTAYAARIAARPAAQRAEAKDKQLAA